MTSVASLPVGHAATALPGHSPDSPTGEIPFRTDGYGAQVIAATGLDGLAEEGSLFVARNTTLGTGMTWVAAQTAYGATAPNFHIRNTAVAGGKSIYLRSLKMLVKAVATGTTANYYAAVLDTCLRAIGTDNTVAITPVNVNGNASNSLDALINAQNSATVSVMSAATAGARVLAHGSLGGICVVGEELNIVFGGQAGGGTYASAVSGAGCPGRRVSNAPPIVIGPQQSLSLMFWAVGSSAAPDPEFELLFSVK
jgi:hypothetical protein